MTDLYKVVRIEGKGKGCVALVNIRKGTLILEEKPQCEATKIGGKNPDSSYNLDVADVIEAFGRMSNNEKDEYLKLCNNYSSSDKIPHEWTLSYTLLHSQMENASGFVKEFIQEHGYQEFCNVIGIYFTNTFECGLGIQASRFNHSCCPNANAFWNEGKHTREIRAVVKIRKGEEIFIKYGGNSMSDLKSRQKLLSSKYGFSCNCELCQNEVLSNDSGRYERFDLLKEQANELFKISNQPTLNYPKRKETTQKEISCYKEMYKLVQFDPMKRFIPYYIFVIDGIIDEGFRAAVQGFGSAKTWYDLSGMECFKEECKHFSKVGYKLSITISGENSDLTKDWGERYSDFEQWMKHDAGFKETKSSFFNLKY